MGNAISSVIVIVSVLIGSGYSIQKIHSIVKKAALEKVHHGMPSLSNFTKKMTGYKRTDFQGRKTKGIGRAAQN